MILFDTHIWVWWVSEHPDLPQHLRSYLQSHTDSRFGVSIISCWEVAKLVERGRLQLTILVDEWIESALRYPEISLLDLTPQIAVKSTQLPGDFHRDPADQIIVATARHYNLPLATLDAKILAYPHVKVVNLRNDA